MDYHFERQVCEAVEIMGTPKAASEYMKLTIRSEFCCSSCCPSAWNSLNEYLSLWGNLDQRKMIKVEKYGTVLTYEHHETGAEIIAYLALGTAILSLAKSIVDVIVAAINGMKKDTKTKNSRITIIVQNGRIERTIFDSWLPLSKEEKESLKVVIRDVIGAHVKTGGNPQQLLPDPVELFVWKDPSARSVRLAVEFNDWKGEEMSCRGEGVWFCQIALKPGRYQYKFIVDGQWRTDPCSTQTQDNKGNWNSVIYVE